MSGGEQRYCPACGALLTPGAALCGECGARFQQSPFARSSTDAPGAWAAPPRPREAEAPAPPREEAPPQIAHAPRDAWGSPAPAVPPQPAPTWGSPAPAPAPAAPAWGSPAPAPAAPARGSSGPDDPAAPSTAPGAPAPVPAPPRELQPPLDGCEVAGIGPRLGAWLIDGVISTLVAVPFVIGIVMIAEQASASLVAQILTGVGVALIAAWAIVSLWLLGARALSPGLAILGLRVVRARTGRTLGFLRALGRSVVFGLPFVAFVSAVMILVDSRTRRGLHDRAVDAIALDVRRSRNPLLARPDDYARAGDEHYVPRSPVPVRAHAKLITRPGSPWGLDESGESAWDAPAAVATGEGAVIERSPWEPSTGEMHRSSAPSASSAAEPPAAEAPAVEAPATDSVAQAPAPWTAPPAPPRAEAADPVAPTGPEPVALSPALAPAPSPSPAWTEPAPSAVEPWPPHEHAVPDEDDGDDDLDRTRIAARPLRARRIALTLDGEDEREVGSVVVLGRNPSPEGPAAGAEAVALADSTRSVSKTHLLLEVRGGAVVATDLGSTNGTAVVDGEERRLLTPHEARELGAAAVLALGDRTLDVRVAP
ncbi:RDD family protein [Brachybacterium huguangmaarense]